MRVEASKLDDIIRRRKRFEPFIDKRRRFCGHRSVALEGNRGYLAHPTRFERVTFAFGAI
jgi:hypothetical protein